MAGKVRVAGFGVSLDGFGAGPGQALEEPMGVGGMALHQWIFPTATFQKMHVPGTKGGTGTTGVDDQFAQRAMANLGAWVLGRNMFGPVRGAWSSQPDWNGWWGDEPPYHCPVFVLTHHPRPPLKLADTTFHFVTSGIHDALAQARKAAGARDVRIGGGVATVRAYLKERAIDELHLAVAPALLGSGENLYTGLNLAELGYRCVENVAGEGAMHVVLRRPSA